MKKILTIVLLVLALIQISSYGQMSNLGYNPRVSHMLDRLETSGQIKNQHLSIRSISLSNVIANSVDSSSLSRVAMYDWRKMMLNIPDANRFMAEDGLPVEQLKKGFLKTFYKSSHSMYTLKHEDLFLKIDPILQFEIGDDTKDNNFIFQNTRGIRLRGTIDNKVYFHTEILENQQRFLNFEELEIIRINAIPGQGFFKPYQSGIIDRLNGWDFLNANAYVGLKISKSIDLQLGHGRHFIGNGLRSMLLSDYANNYFYLQLNTRIWKFHYQNTFAELSATSSRDNIGNQLLPKKYMATHYLDFEVNSKLTIGLFESVIFSRQNNFEFQYLNPVILYRSVEQFLDSPDNAVLGLNIKWAFNKNMYAYGQLLIDELRTDQAFSGEGWWGNKIGYQVGLKYFDLFDIDHFDVQIEYNSARPYTYAHRDEEVDRTPTTSYAHFNQALAHPFGANFRETIATIKYRPHPKIELQAIIQSAMYGNSNDVNVGRNILANYENRASDFGNFTGQGIRNDISSLHFSASFEFFPNYYLDFRYVNRSQNSEDQSILRTNYLGFGMRANIFNRPFLL